MFISKDRRIVYYNMLTNCRTRVVSAPKESALSDFAVVDPKAKSLVVTCFDEGLYMLSE